MGGASSAKFRIGSLVNRNRKEKLSHHVAMVAHFLDDNKTKTSLKKLIRCFILHRSYSVSFNLSNVGEIFWSCIRRLRKRKFCVVFTYSRKKAHEIRKFYVTVVQRLLRNLQECDARAPLLFCYYFLTVSCYLRRRRWFSSLIL